MGIDSTSARSPWTWPHLLSLDAPLVAVVWQLLFVNTLHTHLRPIVTLVMALVIWLVYVADRILDSFHPGDGAPEAARHEFYREHRTAFFAPFFAILIFTAWASFADLTEKMQRGGILLALAVGAYFCIVHALRARARGWFPKEGIVAILFAVGTFMPVAIRSGGIHFSFLLPLLLFVLVLWINTLLIEYSEWVTLRAGKVDRPHESTIAAGRNLVTFSMIVGALALCAMTSRIFSSARPVLLAEALSALALAALALSWKSVSACVMRIAADVTLLTPAILLLAMRK